MELSFAKAIDPIFLAALALERKIEERINVQIADERGELVRLFELADAYFGPAAKEWTLAKYALCSWIDSRMIHLPGIEGSWWKENCLEQKFFNERVAHVKFFELANEATSFPGKNALEVYFLAVVLGFRGFYMDNDPSGLEENARRLQLPSTISEWCERTARSLHLRQRLPIPSSTTMVPGINSPLMARSFLLSSSILSTLLVAIAIACSIIIFGIPS